MLDTVHSIELFSVDGLTFGIRVLDGAVAVSSGESQISRSSVIDLLASSKPEDPIDLSRPSYDPHVGATSITLMVAQRCNLRCTYCYGSAGEYGSPGMLEHFAAAEALRNFLTRSGPTDRNVNFFGGEPLLAFREIQRLVLHALSLAVTHERALTFTLTTNATLATEDIAQWLAQHSFSVVVSIDGDPGMHGRNRPDALGQNSWNAVVRGARELLRWLGPDRVRARSTLTSGYPEISNMVETLRKIGFSTIHLGAVEPTATGMVGGWTGDDYEKFHKTTAEIVSPQHWIDGQEPAWDPLRDVLGLLTTGRRRERACGVGNSALAVSSDGHRYPCHRYVGDTRFRLDVSGGALAYEEHRALAMAECHSCYVKAFCAGGCAHVSMQRMDAGLTPHAPDECEFIRAQTKEAIRVFARLRIPPAEGKAEFLGPDYLTRPMHTIQLREIITQQRLATGPRSTQYSEIHAHIREAFAQAMDHLRRRLPPDERDRPSMCSPDGQDWLTIGLPPYLVAEGVIRNPDTGTARLAGFATAVVAYIQGLSSISSDDELLRLGWLAGYTEAMRFVAGFHVDKRLDEVFQLLLHDYIGAREAEAQWVVGTAIPKNWATIVEQKHRGLALPAILLARVYGAEDVENDIHRMIMCAGPMRQYLDDYSDVIEDDQQQKLNFWHAFWNRAMGPVQSATWPRILGDKNAARLVERHITAACNGGSERGGWIVGALKEYESFLHPGVEKVRQRWASQHSEPLTTSGLSASLVRLTA